MSAVEKLKTLEPVAVHHDLHRLTDALPRIVAVIEAAEYARGWAHMPADLRWEDFDAALVALEEVLA